MGTLDIQSSWTMVRPHHHCSLGYHKHVTSKLWLWSWFWVQQTTMMVHHLVACQYTSVPTPKLCHVVSSVIYTYTLVVWPLISNPQVPVHHQSRVLLLTVRGCSGCSSCCWLTPLLPPILHIGLLLPVTVLVQVVHSRPGVGLGCCDCIVSVWQLALVHHDHWLCYSNFDIDWPLLAGQWVTSQVTTYNVTSVVLNRLLHAVCICVPSAALQTAQSVVHTIITIVTNSGKPHRLLYHPHLHPLQFQTLQQLIFPQSLPL